MAIAIGILLIILNSIFNLFISYKYFSNKQLTKKTNSIFITSTIFYSCALAGLLVLAVYGLSEELKEPHSDNTGMILAITLLFFFVIGLYILIMQLSIRKFIEANYKKTIRSLIENIGEQQE